MENVWQLYTISCSTNMYFQVGFGELNLKSIITLLFHLIDILTEKVQQQIVGIVACKCIKETANYLFTC